MRRLRKGKISALKRKADKLYSEIIRSRGYCEAKGAGLRTCSQYLQCAHVVPRTNSTLRFDPMNGLCLCNVHHLYWAHLDPIGFSMWFEKKFSDRYEYLMLNRIKLTKRTLADYVELVDKLEKLWKEKESLL